ncbi:MAG: helix-turn-helix transcriptional regulator [Niabella sp.]
MERAMELVLPNNRLLSFKEGMPEHFTGPLLRGANVLSAAINNTEAVIQHFAGQEYSLQLCTGKLVKKIVAPKALQVGYMQATFVLKNSIRKRITHLKRLHVREQYYSTVLNKTGNCSVVFNTPGEFKIFSISYSPKLLDEVAPFFALQKRKRIRIDGVTRWITPRIREVLTQLIDCTFVESSRQFYYDLKVKELLYEIFQNALAASAARHQFTPFEVARIVQAKDILEGYIDKKPISIKELSLKVGLNEYKLKKGFQQQYNSSIHEWLVEQKMQTARRLVLTTNKPVKEMAVLTGYSKISNFIAAFKNKFGVSPGVLRK